MSDAARTERWRRVWWIAPLVVVALAGAAAGVMLAPALGNRVAVPRQLVVHLRPDDSGAQLPTTKVGSHRRHHHPRGHPPQTRPPTAPPTTPPPSVSRPPSPAATPSAEIVVTPRRTVIRTTPGSDRSHEPGDDRTGRPEPGDH